MSSKFVLFQDCFDYSECLALLYKYEDHFAHFSEDGSINFDRSYAESVGQFVEFCHLNSIVFQSINTEYPSISLISIANVL